MTVEEVNLLHKKASTRKDGVYSFQGNLWAVKNNKFVAFVDPYGNCAQRYGSLCLSIGNLSNYDRWERKEKFKEWLKSQ